MFKLKLAQWYTVCMSKKILYQLLGAYAGASLGLGTKNKKRLERLHLLPQDQTTTATTTPTNMILLKN